MTTNFGGVDVVPLQGAIVVCHYCWVPLQGAIVVVLVEGKAKVNFGGGAIAGAIVVCHVGGEGDDQLWGSGLVPLLFGGVDVVPLLGAIAGCHAV